MPTSIPEPLQGVLRDRFNGNSGGVGTHELYGEDLTPEDFITE